MARKKAAMYLFCVALLPLLSGLALGHEQDGSDDLRVVLPMTLPEPMTVAAIVGGSVVVGGIVYKLRRR